MHSYFYFNIMFGNLSAQQRQGEGGIYRIRGPVSVERHFLECSVCIIGRLARIMDYTRLCLNFLSSNPQRPRPLPACSGVEYVVP